MSLDTLYTPQESTTNFSFDFQSKILGLQVILCNLTQSIATERQFYTQQIKCLKKDPYDFHSHMLLNRNNNDKNENKNKCSNSINNDSIDDRASLSGSGDKLQSPARSPSPPSTRSPTKFTSPLRKSPPNPGPRLHCGHSSSEGLELEGDDIPASLARGHHSTRSVSSFQYSFLLPNMPSLHIGYNWKCRLVEPGKTQNLQHLVDHSEMFQ